MRNLQLFSYRATTLLPRDAGRVVAMANDDWKVPVGEGDMLPAPNSRRGIPAKAIDAASEVLFRVDWEWETFEEIATDVLQAVEAAGFQLVPQATRTV